MTTAKLIGNVLGAAIVLGATEKYILRPLHKKKRKSKHINIFDI